jgi:hypothetical protein
MPLMPIPPMPMKCACCEVVNIEEKTQSSRTRGNEHGRWTKVARNLFEKPLLKST